MENLYICKEGNKCKVPCVHRSPHVYKKRCDEFTRICPTCKKITEEFLKEEDMEM